MTIHPIFGPAIAAARGHAQAYAAEGEAERLRKLLREAREHVAEMPLATSADLVERIDAALGIEGR